MRWTELTEIARRRGNVVLLADADRVGIPRRTLREHAKRHGWRKLHAGVWLLPGAPMDHPTLLTAALASAGPPALGARRSVLHRHGLISAPPRPEIVVPDDRRLSSPRIEVLRTSHREVLDANRDGKLCGPEVALIQAVRVFEDDPFRSLLIDARQRRVADLGRVSDLLELLTGIPGRCRLLGLLGDLRVDGSDSTLESRFREEARRRGFAPSDAPVRIETRTGPVHVDVVFPWKVAVECVGFGGHSRREHLDVDARRANSVALLDEWLVLQLTWDRWQNDRDGFFAELAAALAQRRGR